jgi:hypothetical protein
LDFSDNIITDVGAIALSKNTTLRILNLNNNTDDVDVSGLSNNTSLRELDFRSNLVTDIGAVALSKNTTLRKLELYGNPITQNGITALFKNTSLRELDLSYRGFTYKGIVPLSENVTLRKLNLGVNRIPADDILINGQSIQVISKLVKREFWSFYLAFFKIYCRMNGKLNNFREHNSLCSRKLQKTLNMFVKIEKFFSEFYKENVVTHNEFISQS